MAADYGQDISCLGDLNPRLALVSGTANVGQALANRLQTPRGGLFYDPNYGSDIRTYLNETITANTLARIQSDVSAECRKDERVLACACTAQFTLAQSRLTLTITVTTADGPFSLVLGVTAVSVTVLSLN